jgi:hypothetical protein
MKRSPLYVLGLAIAAGPVFVVACGGGEPEPRTPVAEAPPPAPEPTAPPAPTPIATAEPTPPPAPAVTVEDMTASPEPTPAPTVKILAPANESAIADATKAKDATVRLDVKNWPTGEGMSHVHVILDDHPYKAVFDPKAPIKIAELLPAGAELTEGQHVLTAFPSRPTHEAVRGKGALAQVTFWVGKKGKPTIDLKKPQLIYSRPKGTYGGDLTKEVMIDFFLVGTNLEDGHKVRYTITGPGIATPVTGEFTKWAPKIVKNLQKGEYTFKLDLLGKDGAQLEGPMTSTTRTVMIAPDQPAETHMGMAPMTMGSTMPGTSTSAAPGAKGAAPAVKGTGAGATGTGAGATGTGAGATGTGAGAAGTGTGAGTTK